MALSSSGLTQAPVCILVHDPLVNTLENVVACSASYNCRAASSVRILRWNIHDRASDDELKYRTQDFPVMLQNMPTITNQVLFTKLMTLKLNPVFSAANFSCYFVRTDVVPANIHSSDMYGSWHSAVDSDPWVALSVAERRLSARYKHEVVVVDDKLYIVGGSRSGRYLSDFQAGRRLSTRYKHEAVVVDDKLYIVGGSRSGRYLFDFQGVVSQQARGHIRCAGFRCIGDLIFGHSQNLDILSSKSLGDEPQGTYVYDAFFNPYISKHEPDIDRNIMELRTRAGNMFVLYWQRAASYGQTEIFDVLQYVASHSSSDNDGWIYSRKNLLRCSENGAKVIRNSEGEATIRSKNHTKRRARNIFKEVFGENEGEKLLKASQWFYPGLTGGSNDSYIRHMLLRARNKGWRVVVFNSRGCGHGPLTIPQPGLTGGSNDSYIRHMLLRARNKGWRVVVFNSRGCGHGPLTIPQLGENDNLIDAVNPDSRKEISVVGDANMRMLKHGEKRLFQISEYARLNYEGFYTMVLEKDDILLCVASLRRWVIKMIAAKSTNMQEVLKTSYLVHLFFANFTMRVDLEGKTYMQIRAMEMIEGFRTQRADKQLVHVKILVGKQCGFVQFDERCCDEEALRMLQGTQFGGQTVRLSWGLSPASKQRHVAGERYPQRHVAGEYSLGKLRKGFFPQR
ncbi:putative HVA22-like protein g [Tanacetum coccineum]|uniref:HVA22-like protein g n=1 Tax=Tanacetum coccineum TaxID=301880 RepID=A0ABQ5GF63_9ASTR